MKKNVKILITVLVVAVVVVGGSFFMTGGLQGKISLNQNATRAEFSKMLAPVLANAKGEYLNNVVSDANCSIFSDVKISDSYGPAVCYLYLNDIIKGYADGQFKPNSNLNRAEAVKFMWSVYALVIVNDNLDPDTTPTSSGQAYSDVTEDGWHYSYINSAAELGITDIKPFKGNKFYPWTLLTVGRAQNMVNKLDGLL